MWAGLAPALAHCPTGCPPSRPPPPGGRGSLFCLHRVVVSLARAGLGGDGGAPPPMPVFQLASPLRVGKAVSSSPACLLYPSCGRTLETASVSSFCSPAPGSPVLGDSGLHEYRLSLALLLVGPGMWGGKWSSDSHPLLPPPGQKPLLDSATPSSSRPFFSPGFPCQISRRSGLHPLPPLPLHPLTP